MQEEVTRKTIAIAIKAAKLDGKLLQAALRKFCRYTAKREIRPTGGSRR